MTSTRGALLMSSALLGVGFALAAAPLSAAAASTTPRALPTIGTFAANRHTLPSTGGVVLLRVRTQNATQCRLTFENPQHVGAIFRRSASICNGSYRIIVGQNTASVAVPLVFRYEVRDGDRSVSRVLNLSEAPYAPTTPGTSTPTTPGTSTPPPPSAPTASLLISANTIP